MALDFKVQLQRLTLTTRYEVGSQQYDPNCSEGFANDPSTDISLPQGGTPPLRNPPVTYLEEKPHKHLPLDAKALYAMNLIKYST